MNIEFPADLLASLASAAAHAGTTPEQLIVTTLQAKFGASRTDSARPLPADGGPTLYDRLSKYIGVVDGPSESFSDERLAEMIAEDLERERK